MAELIAQIDGAVYVERVALFDAKQRVKAKKAIRRAVKAQADNLGFALVEVLSECPLHLGLTPSEAEKWVRENMVPMFPLGVKKDVAATPWPEWKSPRFDPDHLIGLVGGTAEAPPRFASRFPRHVFGEDVGLKLAGAGGDGAQTAAMLIARAAINEGFDATHIPSYGPESRGGTSYADVRIAPDEVLSPAVPQPHALLAFNAPSLAKFGPAVLAGGTIVYDSSVIAEPPPTRPGVRVAGFPCSEAAKDLGRLVVKNIVALGAFHEVTRLFPEETYLTAIRQVLRDKCALVPINEQAFGLGMKMARSAEEKS
jgi:2-oxoisovalerate ferredoxin oxidoreductase beta subunit